MAEGGLLYWRRQRHDGTKYQDFDELIRPLPPPPQGMMWIKTRVVVAEGKEEEEEGEDLEGEDEVSEAGQNEGEGRQEKDDSDSLPIATPVQGEGVDTAVPQVRPPRFLTRWELVERATVGKNGKNDEGGQGGGGKNGQGGDEDDDMLEGGEEGEGTGPAFLTHVVLPTDTMQGLRLRYKVTPSDLRLHNDFAGDQFHMLQTLKVRRVHFCVCPAPAHSPSFSPSFLPDSFETGRCQPRSQVSPASNPSRAPTALHQRHQMHG